ncbi:MAG: hypothetical protein GOMPHAMPRED_006508 [Gomphillus americanus]|uniref:Uncharacterized protein n=1 Tax=Gomphillus americanus TaxID=1940652 RepID=A0A8H3G2Z0_9LECA|nr:MAG: hypothetical protein GOMPHAMPRED_006508 [Gomphillus americanus]
MARLFGRRDASEAEHMLPLMPLQSNRDSREARDHTETTENSRNGDTESDSGIFYDSVEHQPSHDDSSSIERDPPLPGNRAQTSDQTGQAGTKPFSIHESIKFWVAIGGFIIGIAAIILSAIQVFFVVTDHNKHQPASAEASAPPGNTISRRWQFVPRSITNQPTFEPLNGLMYKIRHAARNGYTIIDVESRIHSFRM